jgi:hypothetical protein
MYMVPRRGRPSQTWKTFLRNHADGIASIDLFVVPSITIEQLYAFLVLGHGRPFKHPGLNRRIVSNDSVTSPFSHDIAQAIPDNASRDLDEKAVGCGQEGVDKMGRLPETIEGTETLRAKKLAVPLQCMTN